MIISTEKAPAAIGPYSQAICESGICFISGQLGLDPETGALAEGIEAQTHQSMKNIGSILSAAGMGYENLVKTTIFVTDLQCFGTVNQIYGSYLSGAFPSRACVQVAALPKGGLVEIEAIAIKK